MSTNPPTRFLGIDLTCCTCRNNQAPTAPVCSACQGHGTFAAYPNAAAGAVEFSEGRLFYFATDYTDTEGVADMAALYAACDTMVDEVRMAELFACSAISRFGADMQASFNARKACGRVLARMLGDDATRLVGILETAMEFRLPCKRIADAIATLTVAATEVAA